MERKRRHRLVTLLMALTMPAAAAAIFLTASSVTPAPRTTRLGIEAAIARVEAVTYEDIHPYLDAVLTARSGRLMFCGNMNFNRLARRDPLLEAIARLATNLSIDDGSRVRQFLTWRVADGESPWGFHELPPVRERTEPYVEQAKLQTIEMIRKQDAGGVKVAIGQKP